MSTVSIILFAIAALFGFWQLANIWIVGQYARAGRAARTSLGPGIVAVLLAGSGYLLR